MSLASRISRIVRPLVPSKAHSAAQTGQRTAPVVHYLPAADFPQSRVPEEFREVIDLSAGATPKGVELKRPLGSNCVLIRDKRHADADLRLVIQPSKRKNRQSNVTIEIGKVTGKVHLTVIGGNCSVSFGYCRQFNCNIDMGLDSHVSVGDDCSAGHVRIMAARGDMSIGRDCMLSGMVVMNAGIHHAIIDLSGDQPELMPQRMNMSVGDHVWIGQQAYLVGRAQVGSGAIIGARAVVPANVPANTLVVGNPAVVKKSNITWARPPDEIDDLSQAYIDAHYEDQDPSFAGLPGNLETVASASMLREDGLQ